MLLLFVLPSSMCHFRFLVLDGYSGSCREWETGAEDREAVQLPLRDRTQKLQWHSAHVLLARSPHMAAPSWGP